MKLGKTAWCVVALVVAATLFLVATRTDVYNATSPRAMTRHVFGPDVVAFAHPWWLSLHIWLRKAYSMVAFTLVGYTANLALGKTARPALRAALIVGTFSLLIEIAQRLYVAPESNSESAFDVACGALGGWLAITLDQSFSRARGGRRPQRPAARDPR